MPHALRPSDASEIDSSFGSDPEHAAGEVSPDSDSAVEQVPAEQLDPSRRR